MVDEKSETSAVFMRKSHILNIAKTWKNILPLLLLGQIAKKYGGKNTPNAFKRVLRILIKYINIVILLISQQNY